MTTVLWPFVWNYPDEVVTEESTFTHSHLSSPTTILYQLCPSTMTYSIRYSLFNLHAWQSFCITPLQVLFGLSLGLEPSTSYSTHFFTQSLYSQHMSIPSQPVLLQYQDYVISNFPYSVVISDYQPKLNTILHCVSENGHPFCFCYNFVSRDQILVFFGSLVAKEICNRPLLTYLKVIAGALH